MDKKELLQQIKEMIEKTSAILDKLDQDKDWYRFGVMVRVEFHLTKTKTELEKVVAQYVSEEGE